MRTDHPPLIYRPSRPVTDARNPTEFLCLVLPPRRVWFSVFFTGDNCKVLTRITTVFAVLCSGHYIAMEVRVPHMFGRPITCRLVLVG